MRAFVFTDRSLAERAGQFVWLEIDTEKAKNASFRKKFPVPALPTFLIVDPASEKVALRWVGGATLPQLHAMLDDGIAAVRGPAASAAAPALGAADRELARADALYGAGSDAEAAIAYRSALASAPGDWPRYSRTVESLLFALQSVDSLESSALLAREALPRLRRTSSAANVVATGLSGALGLPKENALRAELIRELESAAREVAIDSTLALAADDRSAVLGTLVDARSDGGDSAGARQAAEDWAAFLEREATRAKTPDARAVFDSHRLSAYIELGQPERAIPMLEASERDLPDDYNPPARLAAAYNAMKRWNDALAASDRALRKIYGPRRLRVLQARADSYVGLGDTARARSTLEEAVAAAEAMPPGQRSESTIASIKKKVAALSSPSSPR